MFVCKRAFRGSDGNVHSSAGETPVRRAMTDEVQGIEPALLDKLQVIDVPMLEAAVREDIRNSFEDPVRGEQRAAEARLAEARALKLSFKSAAR